MVEKLMAGEIQPRIFEKQILTSLVKCIWSPTALVSFIRDTSGKAISNIVFYGRKFMAHDLILSNSFFNFSEKNRYPY